MKKSILFILTLSFFLLCLKLNIVSFASSYTYKVVKNHQLTCAEQVTWGNIIKVKVVDENNNPLSNIEVEYWPDFPYHYTDKQSQPEGILITNGQGETQFDNRSPGCLPCSDGEGHRINYFFKIKNSLSDTAVEVSSGLYGDECPGGFCPGMSAVNVWGHWAYEIVFQRRSGEISEEEIPTDHAGQAGVPENERSNCKFWDFYIPYKDVNPKRNGSFPNQQPPSTPTSIPYPTSQPTGIPTPTIFVYPTKPISRPLPTKKILPKQFTPTMTSFQPVPTSTPFIKFSKLDIKKTIIKSDRIFNVIGDIFQRIKQLDNNLELFLNRLILRNSNINL